MQISLRHAALAIALAVAVPAGAAYAQDPAEGVKLEKTATHGDWDVLCAPNGACAIEQAGKSADGQEMLKLRMTKVPPRDTEQGKVDTVFTALSPLGVVLRAGLAMQVDGGAVERMPYEICTRNGCMVQTLVMPKFIEAFKKGVKANFTVIAPGNKQVTAEISLSGFTKAYNSLKAAN